MDIISDDDAWGEFKSTTKQDGSAGAPSTTAGLDGTSGERDEPPHSVVHQQQQRQPEAEEPESAAAGGKEDEHGSTDTAALAGPAILPPAAELRDASNEGMMDVKAAESPEQQQQQQQPPSRDDNSGSGADLLNLLPVPTTAGSGVSTVVESSDLFGSMLTSAPENAVHKLPAHANSGGSGAGAAGVVAVTDGFMGVSASPEGEIVGGGENDTEWGGFEQPGAEERDSAPAQPTPPVAAEKVDGEWIDPVGLGSGSGSGSDQLEGGKEGSVTAADDEKNGDEVTVAVGREEHELHLDAQQLPPGESLMVDVGCENESGDLLVESDGVGSATKAALGAASPPANEKPGLTPDGEPRPADEGAGEDVDAPNEGLGDSNAVPESKSPAAAKTPQTSEIGLLADIADISVATGPAVAEEAEAGGAEGTVSGDFERASPSAVLVEARVAAADILDLGDFAGHASADKAAKDGAAAASFDGVHAVTPGGQAEGDEEPSHLAALGAPGAASMDGLGLGDFEGPPPAAEATAVDGAAVVNPESAAGSEKEGQAMQDETPSRPGAPDATGVVVADLPDWGDFGGATPASTAVKATIDGAAPASSDNADGDEQERHVKDDEEPSPSPAPNATDGAAVDALDFGDFGGPAAAAEATVVVGGAFAASDENGSEGQTKEDEEPSHSAAPGGTPGAAGVAAADVLDWGDFGGAACAAEAAVDGAAADSPESVDGPQQEGQAKEDEVPGDAEGDDEWSAFEAPPTPAQAQDQATEVEFLPRAADENDFSPDFAPVAAGSGVQEESSSGSSDSPPTTATGDGMGESERLVSSDTGEAGDNVGAEGRHLSEAVVPPSDAPAVEWGVLGEAETTSVSPPEESSAGLADDDDAEALPSAMPELGGGADGDASSGWGAFDEAPPAAAVAAGEAKAPVVAAAGDAATVSCGDSAAAAGEMPAAAQAERQVAEESPASAPPSAAAANEEEVHATVEGVVAEKAEAPPAAGGAEADAAGAEENTGGDDDQEEPEASEDDWGSDFGEFEEAPTTDEPEPVTNAAGPPAAVAFPKPLGSAAQSLPYAGPAVGAGGAAAAAAQRETTAGTVGAISGGAMVAAGGGANQSPLEAMVAVFNGAFGEAAEAAATMGAIASRKVPSESGGTGHGEISLDSLADLTYLLAHAEPSRRRTPVRLNQWAKSCILRGIRPVPDALSLQDEDSDQHAGRGRSHVTVVLEVQPSSTPAVPSPRAPPVVEAWRRKAGAGAGAGRPALSSPRASSADLALSSSAKTSPRVVSPSNAPLPLPRKSSATDAAPPRAKPVASPAAVVDQSAGTKKTAARVVSPSSSPPPLPRKPPSAVEPPTMERTAEQPADASPTMGKDTAVVGGQAGLEAKDTAAAVTTTTSVVVDSQGTSAFAAFTTSPGTAGDKADSDEDEFVWSEAVAITPEMPRHPPPRVPMTPPGVEGGSRCVDDKEGSNDSNSVDVRAFAAGGSGDGGDVDVPAVALGGDLAATTEGGKVGDGDGGGDDDDWSDDPFDNFQSAPPASSLAQPPPPPSSVPEGSPLPATTAAADRTASTSPPAEASPWNLDFLMAAPATDGAGEGRVSPAPSAGFGAGGSSTGEGRQTGKPLDLVSQALAGFGIAASGAQDESQAKGGDDVFSAFSEGGGAAGALSNSSNIQGGVLSGGGGGGLKGERDRVSSVDVSDLLRATRLRGGGGRASRPVETLSAEAEARLSALPDLSYMLSQRIRFPLRAAEPLPAAATGEGDD
eukprot:g3863.t1